MTNKLLVQMGNQLHQPHPDEGPEDTTVLLVEDDRLCRAWRYHQQKLGLVIAAMREHAAGLRVAGYSVAYYIGESGVEFSEQVRRTAIEVGAREVVAFDTANLRQQQSLKATLESTGLPIQWRKDPMFINSPAQSLDILHPQRPRMANFYAHQRRQLNVLMDNGKPLGGQWSFDKDNRKSLPAKQSVPELPVPKHSPLTLAALNEVHQRFDAHRGDARQLWLPTTRQGALQWLQQFVETRLLGFGTFEDALSTRSPTLFHSTLSPLLNIGLITPEEVLQAVLTAAAEQQIPINDLEGFVRQLIGWREFVRGTYLRHAEQMRSGNAWNAQRRMADSWRLGQTGILPLDQAMTTANQYAWNHHIERLMIIANLQNLCEIHPQDAFRFFMETHIDAYDWVMVPNLFGMGLTSDNGVFATKPYICGSNYMLRMSDYGKGEWCDTVDGLYWRFIAKHRAKLEAQPRLKMMVGALDRMDGARRERIINQADAFLAAHTLPPK